MVYMDNDGNLTNACVQMKMNTDTFYRWMNDEIFKKYHDFIISLHTDSIEALVWRKLFDKIEKGDVKAIRTYFELRGKLKNVSVDNKHVEYRVEFGKKETDSGVRSTSQAADN